MYLNSVFGVHVCNVSFDYSVNFTSKLFYTSKQSHYMLGLKHTEPPAHSEECPSLCCVSSHCFACQCECCCSCDIAERWPQLCYVFSLDRAMWTGSSFLASALIVSEISVCVCYRHRHVCWLPGLRLASWLKEFIIHFCYFGCDDCWHTQKKPPAS